MGTITLRLEADIAELERDCLELFTILQSRFQITDEFILDVLNKLDCTETMTAGGAGQDWATLVVSLKLSPSNLKLLTAVRAGDFSGVHLKSLI